MFCHDAHCHSAGSVSSALSSTTLRTSCHYHVCHRVWNTRQWNPPQFTTTDEARNTQTLSLLTAGSRCLQEDLSCRFLAKLITGLHIFEPRQNEDKGSRGAALFPPDPVLLSHSSPAGLLCHTQQLTTKPPAIAIRHQGTKNSTQKKSLIDGPAQHWKSLVAVTHFLAVFSKLLLTSLQHTLSPPYDSPPTIKSHSLSNKDTTLWHSCHLKLWALQGSLH